jgi:hypothetical protein
MDDPVDWTNSELALLIDYQYYMDDPVDWTTSELALLIDY